jgi:hypothetical protein
MSYPLRLFLILVFLSNFSVLQAQKDSLSFGVDQLAEKVLDWVTIDGKKVNTVFYPIGGYDEQNGLSVGVMPIIVWKSENKKETYSRPTSLIPSLEISTKGMVDADLSLILFDLGRWNIYSSGYYSKGPNQYYGINAQNENELTNFQNNIGGIFGELSYELSSIVFLGLRYEFQSMRITELDGTSLNPEVLGFEGGNLLGFGPVLKIDTRDNIVYPARGMYFQAGTAFYSDKLGSDYSFSNYYIDWSQFYSFNDKRTILGQNIKVNYKTDGLPFYAMNSLGTKTNLRFIGTPNRFVNQGMWLYQIELRQDIWWRISAVLFAGIGDTFDNQDDLAFDQPKFGGGFGLRFRLSEEIRINFRMDLGWGNYHQNGVWLTSREAF